jgi:hypothetical protein
MKHIDEHTLEMYVLKAKVIAGRIDEIEEHLGECSGCHALVSEMTQFYEELQEELKNVPDTSISSERALIRRNLHLETVFEENVPAYNFRPATPLAKIFYFIRRHPVPVTMGSFMLFAAFGWWLNSFTDSFSFWKDKSPDTYIYDTKSDSIVVLNKSNEKLWGLRSDRLSKIIDRENGSGSRYTYLEDIDNDGDKELITSVSPIYAASGLPKNNLRIFNYKGVLRKDIPLYEPFNYLDRKHYNLNFSVDPIVIYTDPQTSSKEIFVGAVCVGSSPNFIARMNAEGEIIGEYWHHGAISGMFLIDEDVRSKIIAYGQNDTKDTLAKPFSTGAIIILDPMRISEKEASSISPGYQFKRSDAELYYVLFPLFDVNYAFNANSSVQKIEKAGVDRLKATLRLDSIGKGMLPPIYFTFSKDMHVLDVRLSDEFSFTYSIWKKQGLVKERLDDKYTKKLMNGLRYWDGKEWQRDWTSVKY